MLPYHIIFEGFICKPIIYMFYFLNLGGHDSQALKEEYQKLSSSTYISPACFLNIAGVCHFFVCKHILNELEKMLVGNFS